MKNFPLWFSELKTLARKHGIDDMIDSSDDMWSEMFHDDYTPSEALNEFYMECCASV